MQKDFLILVRGLFVPMRYKNVQFGTDQNLVDEFKISPGCLDSITVFL